MFDVVNRRLAFVRHAYEISIPASGPELKIETVQSRVEVQNGIAHGVDGPPVHDNFAMPRQLKSYLAASVSQPNLEIVVVLAAKAEGFVVGSEFTDVV